jgi:cyclic-di-AMP phosphodiesterase PgpH
VDEATRQYWMVRLLIGAIVLIGVPAVLSVPAFRAEAPIRVAEDSPRTVFAPRLIRVEDDEATERARREAAEAVDPIFQFEPEAQNAVVSQVRDYFALVSEVRQPAVPEEEDEAPAVPTTDEQTEALRERLPMLDDRGLEILVNAGDQRLERITQETIDIAQQLARQRIREDEIDSVIDEQLRTELAVRDLSMEVGDEVVAPFIMSAMRPTVSVDEEATARARRDAAANVSEVVRSFPAGSVIVSAGEEVTSAQYAALERAGLVGAEPRGEVLRAAGIVLVALVVVAIYLRVYRRRMWGSNRDLLLLATLLFAYAMLLGSVGAVVDRNDLWLYAVPVGALTMLTSILLSPPVGVLVSVPAILLTAFVAPGAPGVIAFVAAAALVSVPWVTRLSARGDLRRATLYASVAYVGLAGLFAAVFTGIEAVPTALLAGVIHGLATAMIVLGVLPFLESAFSIVTATSLVDLTDRNHPLLRELEQKALGSYNHSIVVSTLVERACRSIDADPLLGAACALYHDIGKVQRPYFFVENQFGIRNPHDDLEPEVSARLIQKHVEDGIEMATEHNLPPEIVEGIATHHGTTLVTYFYLEAVRKARPDEDVREQAFRYRGRKPRTKETAVLMLADCCEAASRAAAQNDRNLTRQQLEDLVEALTADRIDDGQLDESPLTFQDLRIVKRSFIETLVGVYHPRVAYPGRDGRGGPQTQSPGHGARPEQPVRAATGSRPGGADGDGGAPVPAGASGGDGRPGDAARNRPPVGDGDGGVSPRDRSPARRS